MTIALSTSPISGSVSVRVIARCDLMRVLNIEAYSTNPWSAEVIEDLVFRGRAVANVALLGSNVVGWCAYSTHDRHIELHRVAVALECRRLGIGRKLTVRVMNKVSERWRQVRCEVPEEQVGPQCFLRSLGFRGEYAYSGAESIEFAWPESVR